MEIGIIYWITGLSGSGKSTTAAALYSILKTRYLNVILLDGDALREAIGNDFNYTLESRKSWALRYAKLCKLFADQGLIVICSTISMFDDIREWNAMNNVHYFEVYLRADLTTLYIRDSKNLYGAEVPFVVGKDLSFEEPKHPHLVITIVDDLHELIIAENIFQASQYMFIDKG